MLSLASSKEWKHEWWSTWFEPFRSNIMPPSVVPAPVPCLQGTLPVVNSEMVRKAVRAGLALGCRIATASKFDRKQYFYPDLPKGYQISQYDAPLCQHGAVEIALPGGASKRIGVTRAHLEEDAGLHGDVLMCKVKCATAEGVPNDRSDCLSLVPSLSLLCNLY